MTTAHPYRSPHTLYREVSGMSAHFYGPIAHERSLSDERSNRKACFTVLSELGRHESHLTAVTEGETAKNKQQPTNPQKAQP